MAHNIKLHSFFQWLRDSGLVKAENLIFPEEGVCLVYKDLSSILAGRGIHSLPDGRGGMLDCACFYDDWFLFAVGDTVSLFKMREQEYDRCRGIRADGDDPGVTVCFIELNTEILRACLEDSHAGNARALEEEINRVVAAPGQIHHPELKNHFLRPEAKTPYHIAGLYVQHIARMAENGCLSVPEGYRDTVSRRHQGRRYARIPDFIEENNRLAGYTVCDHSRIRVSDPERLTREEILAILATHTGNTSFHSFAAEIRFHARFLTPPAKIRLPRIPSPYASALRADMSIADKEFQGPAPYYNPRSRMVKEQQRCHREYP